MANNDGVPNPENADVNVDGKEPGPKEEETMAKGPRINYSMEKLVALSESPLAKLCPSALVINGQANGNSSWLSKIIPGSTPSGTQDPGSAPSSNGDNQSSQSRVNSANSSGSSAQTLGTDDRFRRQEALLPLPIPIPDTAGTAVSLLPQRRSFTTGCQPSSALSLSPQKVIVRNASGFTVKENGPNSGGHQGLRDYRDNENRDYRDRPQDSSSRSLGIGNREFINRNQSGGSGQGPQGNHRYAFHNERDRYPRSGQDRGDFRRNDRFDRDRDREREKDGREPDRQTWRDREDKPEEFQSSYLDTDEEEPAWMGDGPTSRHDVMELRGFDDDKRGLDDGAESRGGADKNVPSGEHRGNQGSVQDVKVKEEKTATGDLQRGPSQQRVSPSVAMENDVGKEGRGVSRLSNDEASATDQASAFGGRSRFSAFFMGDDIGASNANANSGPIRHGSDGPPPIASVPSPSVAPEKSHVIHNMTPQEAGRSLLQMLQPKHQQTVSNSGPGAMTRAAVQPSDGWPAAGDASSSGGTSIKFKTLDDIEGEHQQQQHELAFRSLQQQQQLRMMQNRDNDSGRASPFGSQFVPQSPSPTNQLNQRGPMNAGMQIPQGPPQSRGGIMEMQQMGVPPDPNLHKLLNLTIQELTTMRELGHFDQNTLLTLITMKQRKDNFLKLMAMQNREPQGPGQTPHMQMQRPTQHRGVPFPPMPMPPVAPAPMQYMSHHQPHSPHAAFPQGGHFFGGVSLGPQAPPVGPSGPGSPFSGNMISSQFIQPQPSPQQRQHYPTARDVNMWHQAQAQQQQANNAHLARAMAEEGQRRQEFLFAQQQRSSMMSNPNARPSPLLPTSVMRKNLQRTENPLSGSASTSGSALGSPISGGSILGGFNSMSLSSPTSSSPTLPPTEPSYLNAHY